MVEEVSSGAVTVGKFMVPWSSRIARPEGVCRICGSELLGDGIDVVVDVEMFLEMCTGVTEGHDWIDIVAPCSTLMIFGVYRNQVLFL